MSKKIRSIGLLFLCLMLVVGAWMWKYRENCNYLNSNATWHVLYTIRAYDETPVSVHHFLPIVSMGKDLDKGISWAEMISDSYGNYYYTSFSPATFVLPYIFIKLFHLSVTEQSLYIFNLLLLIATLLVLIKLFLDLKEIQLSKCTIMILVTLLYSFQVEVMHGMGQVYWAQSIMQLILAGQFLCFYHRKDGKAWKRFLGILCLIGPYVEWTGFIANVGFAIALFLDNGIKIKKQNWIEAIKIAFITMMSAGLLTLHYLSVIDVQSFKDALSTRFMARTVYAGTTWFDLAWGYWKSFKPLWMICGTLFVIYAIMAWRKKIRISVSKSLLQMAFVMLFPVFENIVMKEHAVSYTYDRMKLVFFLLLCVLWLWSGIATSDFFARRLVKIYCNALACVIVLAISGYNLYGYVNHAERLWNAEYRTNNERIAKQCGMDYADDSLYGLEDAAVRGYMNMLFGRSIYENTDMEELVKIAEERGARYAVLIVPASEPSIDNCWNMYAIDHVEVVDLYSNIHENIY